MADLKTLTNIMNDIPYDEVSRTRLADDLRSEAIKWIKEIQLNGMFLAKTYAHAPDTEALLPLIRWIKHFFNISEEELKETAVTEADLHVSDKEKT